MIFSCLNEKKIWLPEGTIVLYTVRTKRNDASSPVAAWVPFSQGGGGNLKIAPFSVQLIELEDLGRAINALNRVHVQSPGNFYILGNLNARKLHFQEYFNWKYWNWSCYFLHVLKIWAPLPLWRPLKKLCRGATVPMAPGARPPLNSTSCAFHK